jgi:PEGA domain-containing protein
VQPRGVLQVYVDGYYVGIPDDFNGELELAAGPHRIELRAPGYETLTFDVQIAPQRSVTYRGALKPADAKPAPDFTNPQEPDTTGVAPQPVTPPTPTTFYVIPGCYFGNVAPKDVALPATCDLSLLVTYRP